MKTVKSRKIGNKKVKIVVFYFPFRITSGGPIYLSNLAISLAKDPNYHVIYLEYKDGVARELLKGSNVEVKNYYDDFVFRILPEEEIILVTPIYWGNRVPVLNPKSKIIFFNWHNLCIPSLMEALQCDDAILKDFLKMVSRGNAEFYCDKAHWAAQEKFGVAFEEKYVPIVIPERKIRANSDIVDPETINIAVVGRLVVDKIYAITDLLDNISKGIGIQKKVNLYIIGDGDYRDYLESYQRTDDIQMIFCGTLSIDEMNSVIARKVDILFAMGTSALEGAAIGLPTVIIPNDTTPFQCDRYVYLFDCNSYMLGWGPDQIDYFKLKTYSAREILNQVYVDNKKSLIGEKCREYYLKHHFDNSELFIRAITDTKLTYERYLKVMGNVKLKAREWQRRNILNFLKHNKKKEVVIWGAGKGGKQLLKIMKELGIKVAFFVDKNADNIVEINHIPVVLPNSIKPQSHAVFISLLLFVPEIPKALESLGFEKGVNYLYFRFPNY